MMTVGERIKELRMKLGMSQVDFADKINVSKQTLYKYENNIITNIPIDKIEAAAKIGNVSPGYLMGWENFDIPDVHKIFLMEKDRLLLGIYNLLGYDFYKFISGSCQLPPKERQQLMDYADFLVNKNNIQILSKDEVQQIYEKSIFEKAIVEEINKGLYEALKLPFENDDLILETEDIDTFDTLKAARERTDIEVTDEMRKHDDDIMDDDNF